MKLRGRCFAVLLLLTSLESGAASAENAKFPFVGVFAGGVTPEAITPADLELTCLLQPVYNDASGNLLSLKLDLPFFRSEGKFRYRIVDLGFLQKYDPINKVVSQFPDKEFNGNPYYAPKANFEFIKSINDSGYTFLSFRGINQLVYVFKSHDEKYGNRSAMVKCPFTLEHYLALAVEDKSLPPLAEADAAQNVDLLFNLKPDPGLVKKVLAAKGQLQ